MKLLFCLRGMRLNQSIAAEVFLSWFRSSLVLILSFILSRICLVIFPMFDLQGFMSQHLIDSGKFGL